MYTTDANLKMYEKRHLSGQLKANPDVAPALPHVFQGHQKVLALFRLFPSASLLVAHLGLNPVRVRVRARVRVRVRGLG